MASFLKGQPQGVGEFKVACGPGLGIVANANEASNAVFTALQVSGLNETAVVKNFPYEI